jgi:plasmid maintenance system antidote protein VapI
MSCESHLTRGWLIAQTAASHLEQLATSGRPCGDLVCPGAGHVTGDASRRRALIGAATHVAASASSARLRADAPGEPHQREAVPPGTIFRDQFRLAMSPPISEEDAAARLGWSLRELRLFESGRARVTVARAEALGQITGAIPDFWQGLQHEYDRLRMSPQRARRR